MTYPLDHSDGYAPWPRSAGRFEPLIRDHVALACYMVIWSRVAHEPGWRRGSRGSVQLERGQALLGRSELGQAIGVSKTAAGKALARLESVGLIRATGDRSGTIVTLPFYGEFGDLADARCPQGDRKVTDGCPQGDRKVTLTNGETDKRVNGETLFAAMGVESKAPRVRFDFEIVYQAYPRKVGKKPGLAKLGKSVKTAADYERLRASVELMREGWAGHDLTYCPHFSTYASKELWRDDEPPLPRRDGQRGVGHAKDPDHFVEYALDEICGGDSR